MRYVFDNNLSPHLAHGIRELSAIFPQVESVIHLRDRFPHGTADLAWIEALSKEGRWHIISIDRFKKHHGAEREAIRRAGHTVFVLDGQWSRQGYWLQSERLVKWWPHLIACSPEIKNGAAYRIPWKHSSSTKLQHLVF